MIRRAFALMTTTVLAAACGGGGGASNASPVTPTAPTTPTVASGPNTLSGVVFYDQNSNGTIESDELVRLPEVRIAVGGRTGITDADGRFSVTGLANGPQTVSIQVDSLPPYYQAGQPAATTLPVSADTLMPVPVTLPIAGNRPNTYLAFGDSITEGTGSVRKQGWAVPLEQRLRAHFGEAEVIADGIRASRSPAGTARLPGSLAESRPAFLLLLYGTNDWNNCQSITPEECFTVAELRAMIRTARSAGTQAVVGTIIPANPADERITPARNQWVQSQNELIRSMVQQEGAVLAETWASFGSEPTLWPPLFFDHLHPQDEGYAGISDAFFEAITRSRGTR